MASEDERGRPKTKDGDGRRYFPDISLMRRGHHIQGDTRQAAYDDDKNPSSRALQTCSDRYDKAVLLDCCQNSYEQDD
jgi:hypothetical protein